MKKTKSLTPKQVVDAYNKSANPVLKHRAKKYEEEAKAVLQAMNIPEFFDFLSPRLKKKFQDQKKNTVIEFNVNRHDGTWIREVAFTIYQGVRIKNKKDIVGGAYILARRAEEIDEITPIMGSLLPCCCIEIVVPVKGAKINRFGIPNKSRKEYLVLSYFHVNRYGKELFGSLPEGGCPDPMTSEDQELLKEWRTNQKK